MFYSAAEMVAVKRVPIPNHTMLYLFKYGYMEYLEGEEIWAADIRQYVKIKTYVRTVDYGSIPWC